MRSIKSCIEYRRAHRRIRSRCHWKLEDNYLVEGGNVGIYGGGSGNYGADFLQVPGLTTIEVDRSVKVCHDSRKRSEPKRSEPLLANIGHFLLQLEGTVPGCQLGVYQEIGIFRQQSATRSAATALVMKNKYAVITITMTRDP